MLVACRATKCSLFSGHYLNSYSRNATAERYAIIRNYFLSCSRVQQPHSVVYIFRTIRFSRMTVYCSQSGAHSKIVSRQLNCSPPKLTESLNNEGNPTSTEEPKHNPHLENYPKFFRRLALAVPHLHRPTKDDLLKVTTSFWGRIRVRFKWFTIKSFRRWNADDISAFFTWFLMTQTLWILVGTCVCAA